MYYLKRSIAEFYLGGSEYNLNRKMAFEILLLNGWL